MAKYKCKISKNPTRKLQQGGQLNYPEWQDQIFTSMTPLYDKGGVQEQSIGSSFPIVDKKDATVEAEKGELILTTDNKLYRIGGKTHEKGGSPIAAQQGDFIYSDNVLIKGENLKAILPKIKENSKIYKKGITPAKLASKYLDLNQYKALEENDDPKERKTAMLMQENYMQKLAEIAFMQELEKGMEAGFPERFAEYIPEMALENVDATTNAFYKNGGIVYRKYKNGDPVKVEADKGPLLIPVAPYESYWDEVPLDQMIYMVLTLGKETVQKVLAQLKSELYNEAPSPTGDSNIDQLVSSILYGPRAEQLKKIFKPELINKFIDKAEKIYDRDDYDVEMINNLYDDFSKEVNINSISDPVLFNGDEESASISQNPIYKQGYKGKSFKKYKNYKIPEGLTPEIFYGHPDVVSMLKKDKTFEYAVDDGVWGPEHEKVYKEIIAKDPNAFGIGLDVDMDDEDIVLDEDGKPIINNGSNQKESVSQNTNTIQRQPPQSGYLEDPKTHSLIGEFTADDIGIAGALLQAFMPKHMDAPSREQINPRYVENQKLSDKAAINDILNTVNRTGQQMQSSLNPQVAAAMMSGMMGNAFENIGKVKSNYANANAQMMQQVDQMNAQIFNNVSSMNAQLNAKYDEDVAKYHQAKLNQNLKNIQVATNALSTGSYNDYMNKMLQTSGLADDYIITPQGIQHLGNKNSMFGSSQDQSDSYQSYYDEAMGMTDEELKKSKDAHTYAENKKKLEKSRKTKR